MPFLYRGSPTLCHFVPKKSPACVSLVSRSLCPGEGNAARPTVDKPCLFWPVPGSGLFTIGISPVGSAATTSEVPAFVSAMTVTKKKKWSDVARARPPCDSLKPCQESELQSPSVLTSSSHLTALFFTCFLGAARTPPSHPCGRVTEIGWET